MELIGKNNMVSFPGNCLEALPVCQALCCKKDWFIPILYSEYQSKKYLTDAWCTSSNSKCTDEKRACVYRRRQLQKNNEGDCIYLGKDNKCSIHADKPRVCRDFVCRGWKVAFVPLKEEADLELERAKIDLWWEPLEDDMLFTINPALKIVTIFYAKEKKEVVFILHKKEVCHPIAVKEYYNNPKLNDNYLKSLANLFTGKTLKEIYPMMDEFLVLSRAEKDEITRLLIRSRIILASMHGQ